jgi:hypothetical protein
MVEESDVKSTEEARNDAMKDDATRVVKDAKNLKEARTNMEVDSKAAMAEVSDVKNMGVVRNDVMKEDATRAESNMGEVKINMEVDKINMGAASSKAVVMVEARTNMEVVRNDATKDDATRAESNMGEVRINMEVDNSKVAMAGEDNKTTLTVVDALVAETSPKVESKASCEKINIINTDDTTDSYGGGGGYGGGDDDDLSGAAQHAQQHAGDSGDPSIFSNALGRIGQNKQHIGSQPIDEQGTGYHSHNTRKER